MKRIWWRFILETFMTNLLIVPVSLTVSAFLWVFENHISRNYAPTFSKTSRNVLVDGWCLGTTWNVFVTILLIGVVQTFSKKFEVSVDDVIDGLLRYNMTNERPLSEWDEEWFKRRLRDHRRREAMSRVLTRELYQI